MNHAWEFPVKTLLPKRGGFSLVRDYLKNVIGKTRPYTLVFDVLTND
jgi:hypothetical protein